MPACPAPFVVRPYRPSDERGWLRCRALSFLSTQYYDDVRPRRTPLPEHAIELVAVTPVGDIIGILDVEIDGDAATIDTVATHPDYQAIGVATQLLRAALPLLADAGIATLDAWTREDPAANSWYQRNGFLENARYLHVYLGDDDDSTGFATPEGLSAPVMAFAHGRIEDEAAARARYQRVYVCRQYLRPVALH